MKVRKYSELIAWRKAMDLVQQVYEATKHFPREEMYGLTSQIRRAAVSVPSNIAEGQGRKTTNEFVHRLAIAYGSLMEVETQILIAERLSYLTAGDVARLMDQAGEVGRVMNGLSATLSKKISERSAAGH